LPLNHHLPPWSSFFETKVTTSSYLIPQLATFFPAHPQSPSTTLPTSVNSLSERNLYPISLSPPLVPFLARGPTKKPASYTPAVCHQPHLSYPHPCHLLIISIQSSFQPPTLLHFLSRNILVAPFKITHVDIIFTAYSHK
jgi:hypothetical protein